MSTISDTLCVVYSCRVSDRGDDLRRVGGRLRALRREAGETQAQTAASIGISRQYMSEAESGANLTLAVIYRLADHFGVAPASILDDAARESGEGR